MISQCERIGQDYEEEEVLALMMIKNLLMRKYDTEEELKQESKEPVYDRPIHEEIREEFDVEEGLTLTLLVPNKDTKEN